MLTKVQPDEIQDLLTDASYVKGGYATSVVFPETLTEVCEILRDASRARTPVTISGAGTGTVAGRVPFGGVVLATSKLNRLKQIEQNPLGQPVAVAEAGVVLRDLQQAAEAQKLLYPPDPTERSCFVGGNIATNASGARTFKYGATRNYVERLKIALASGDLIELRRGELFAGAQGRISIPLPNGGTLLAQLPTYTMPHVRKHASGYFVAPGMDLIDLFIGSEGTLGVICEAELKLLPKPAGLLSGVVFFDNEESLLAFVREARERSLRNRVSQDPSSNLDARALEYFNIESLRFLRQKYESVPQQAGGALFFEQETTAANED